MSQVNRTLSIDYVFQLELETTLLFRDQETSPVIASSRSRSGSSSRSKRIPIKKVANPFLVELDDGEDEILINAADFLDQPSQDEGSLSSQGIGEKEKGSERFSLTKTEKAQESTSEGLTTGSVFGTDELFCVLNIQSNKLEVKQPKQVGKEEEEHLSKNDQGRLGDMSVENNQKLGWHPVDEEEDMFASTPELDNNDNDQNHLHQSEDRNIESNWDSDLLAVEHNLENVDSGVVLSKRKGADTLCEVGGISGAVSNSGDRTEKRGKAHADERNIEGGGGERGKGSRRFHQKVVPVNRSARVSTTDLVSFSKHPHITSVPMSAEYVLS